MELGIEALLNRIHQRLWIKGSSELFWSQFVCCPSSSFCHRQYHKLFTFSSSPEPLGLFQPNLVQSILWWREFKFVQMKDTAFFQVEIMTKEWKYINKILKIFFRTTGLISTKLGSKHNWVKRIQVCSNEGPRLFPRVDNSKTVKIL